MGLDRLTGLLNDVSFISSPNCNERPVGATIDLLIIHGISLPPGEFGGDDIIDLFTNRLDCSCHPYFANLVNLKVSAHVLIRRDGQIVQFVPFHLRAWHAGESNFNGREGCNDFSIGIELEGTDDLAYTPEQYQQLVQVTHTIIQAYPEITPERIVGHSDIAPGRKTDPGPAFDWGYYKGLLGSDGMVSF